MSASRKVSVDTEADAGYLHLSDAPIARSVDHSSFVVDLTEDGSPVGVEVLTLDRPLDVDSVLDALSEPAGGIDPSTEEWVRAFASQIQDLDDRVPTPLPSRGNKRPLDEVGFLTVPEIASLLRVSKMTVYRLVHARELPAIRVGRSYRVPERAVHEYLATISSDLEARS